MSSPNKRVAAPVGLANGAFVRSQRQKTTDDESNSSWALFDTEAFDNTRYLPRPSPDLPRPGDEFEELWNSCGTIKA